MSRTALLSALLVVTVVGGLGIGALAAAADQHESDPGGQFGITTAENTSNALSIEGESRPEYIRVDVDVAGATAMSVDQLQGTHTARTFQQRYEQSPNSSARVETVRAAVEQAEGKLDRLNAEHQRLYRAYANGSLDRGTLVRRIARLETEAAEIRSLRERVRRAVDSDASTSLPFSLDRRLSDLRGDIVMLPAPLSSELGSSIAAESDGFIAYVEASDGGVTIARSDTEEYARQTTLRTAYAPDQPNQFEGSITEAYQYALGLYPWVSDNALNGPNLVERGTGIYRINAQHTHGELTAYIHGGSGSAFHEIQRKIPTDVPVTGTLDNETDALTVSLDRTTATGPMRVTVRDPASGPVEATVKINRQVVGTTGSDGQLWTIQPSGGFRVNATVDGESVVVTGP